MKIIKFKIQGPYKIIQKKHLDKRGSFIEAYNKKNFKIIKANFVQDNLVFSKNKYIFRGFHFQKKFPQGKLINVIQGSILDFALDIRKKSKTYGQYIEVKLNKPNEFFWIPRGFAHGYLTLKKNTIVKYKVDNYWFKSDDCCINFINQIPKLKKIKQKILMSSKDLEAPEFNIND